ncbi:MAG: D-alanyl-D-alanine carboxypeptidase, partial [Sphingomonadales bacterium]|nr:D-alanyl-D-alanine carboxypeptidase [Sphingomonadales bacterium]
MLYRSCLLLLAASFTGAAAARSGVDAPPASADLASAAPIALLIDVSSGQTLFARDPDRRFLPASMTKVMTALVAFDLIKAGRLREDDLITVRPETARKLSGKGTSLWLRPGESVRVSDLLD